MVHSNYYPQNQQSLVITIHKGTRHQLSRPHVRRQAGQTRNPKPEPPRRALARHRLACLFYASLFLRSASRVRDSNDHINYDPFMVIIYYSS